MHSRALLIDAMGTLVRLDEPAPRLARELEARFGARVSDAQAATALRAEIRFYRAHLDEGSDLVALAALRARCGAVLHAALPPLAELAGVTAQMMSDVLLAALSFTAYPDARGALERARDAGIRVVVVSNWDVSLDEVLARVGLTALIDAVLTSAGAGARKPDPAIFTRALELAGVSAAACLHVGDSLTEDVAGARAAGIEAVLLDRSGGPSADGVRVLASLDELRWT